MKRYFETGKLREAYLQSGLVHRMAGGRKRSRRPGNSGMPSTRNMRRRRTTRGRAAARTRVKRPMRSWWPHLTHLHFRWYFYALLTGLPDRDL